MHEISLTLITLGGLFLLGLVIDVVGRKLSVPRVTLLMILGILIGPYVFNLLPKQSEAWYPLITHMSLLMVGFLLGEKLSYVFQKSNGKEVLYISLSVSVITASIVFIGLYLIGVSVAAALVLSAIATATAPAATLDVIKANNAKGRFTNSLLGIVAIDDAWGLIIFGFVLAFVEASIGSASESNMILKIIWEIGGAVLLGVLLGIPMAFLVGRIEPGEPTLTEAIGMVFLCGGLALAMEVSFLLAAMVMGGCVAKFSQYKDRPFHAIENIEWPFMVLFFILAGAFLEIGSLQAIGIFGFAYLILRAFGRVVGAFVGGYAAKSDVTTQKYMGLALLPQAGVALGMALIAAQRLPEASSFILPVAIGATIIFELIGPFITQAVLVYVGDIKKNG